MRYADTRYVRAVVETRRPTRVPGGALMRVV
jgi:hypothetical protein